MGKFIYFAYGSNMLTERLQKRCPSAKSIGTAIAHGYYLSFGKRSKDKSGKATLENAVGMLGQDVIGVIFEIDLGERENLDNAEGDGYRRDDAFLVIRSDSGEETSASVYIAKEVVTGLIPYDWYHALILIGAIQNKLPTQYISALYNVP